MAASAASHMWRIVPGLTWRVALALGLSQSISLSLPTAPARAQSCAPPNSCSPVPRPIPRPLDQPIPPPPAQTRDHDVLIEAMRRAYAAGNYEAAQRTGRRLLELDVPQGMTMLGQLVQEGRIAPRNYDLAMGYYVQAAQKRFPEAMRRLGTLFFSKGWSKADPTVGWRHLQDAAAAGDAVAWYEQGKVALDGRMPPRDPALAVTLITKASDAGVADAQADLGAILLRGEIVPRDLPRGKELIVKAVAAGSARGQFALATAMTAGQMRPQVIVAASSYNASTSSEYVEARQMLVEAAGKGEPRAMLALGQMTIEGRGSPIDLVEAYRWLRGVPRAAVDDPFVTSAARIMADSLALKIGPERAAVIDREIEAGIQRRR